MTQPAPRRRNPRAAHNGAPLGPRWRLTDHAVEQYRARVEPLCPSHGEAWHRLLTQARAAERTGRMTLSGGELWLCGDGSGLVVRREHHVLVVVTVLGASMVRLGEPIEDEVA